MKRLLPMGAAGRTWHRHGVARVVIVGNSGSGKSTLAGRLAQRGLAHLDLDVLAWQPVTPPARRALADSVAEMAAFLDAHAGWVVEGCYGDLAAAVLPRATQLVLLNPGVEACIANARLRPWEPHKYASREAQDRSLAMLIGWIRDYEVRGDACSLAAHRALFDGFAGDKRELTTREAIAAYSG
jgi:adenylate kinase family enzyme